MRREQALRRIKKRRDFHAHVFVYLVVNIAVWGVWSGIAVTSWKCSSARLTPAGAPAAIGPTATRAQDARDYAEEEHKAWPVLIDDLTGSRPPAMRTNPRAK